MPESSRQILRLQAAFCTKGLASPPGFDTSRIPLVSVVLALRALAGQSVLVIDDDPTARDIVQRLLARDGVAVTVARTGLEGLARAHKPLAVLLDVLLPGLSGWEMLSRFKGDPQLSSVPVAIYSVVDDRPRARQLNADDYFTKPLASDRLLAFVRGLRGVAVAGPDRAGSCRRAR